MNFKYLLIIATTLYSVFAIAAPDDLQCYLYKGDDMENPIAVTSSNFTAEGSASVSEADAFLAQPEISRYGFNVKVENKVIISMRLEDKSEGIFAEKNDADPGQYKQVTLQSKDTSAILECYLNY